MKLRHRYILCAAALGALLLVIIGAGWKEPPGGATVLTAPVLSALDPSATAAGTPGFTLTVAGAFFADGAVVEWNGADRPTTVVDAGVVRARISAADVVAEGSAAVTVVNPIYPNRRSGVSNVLSFRILPAASSQP